MEKQHSFQRRMIAAVALALGLMAFMAHHTALGIEAADHDGFFLGGGSSNIETSNGDIMTGSNVLGGARIGLLSIFYMELGYGSFGYRDTVDIAGVQKDVTTQAFGPFYGAGFSFQVRKMFLGARVTQSFNNRWTEEIKDTLTAVVDSRQAGRIDYDSYFAYTQFGTPNVGNVEIGIRRDMIRENTSIMKNSFGPYIMFNILMGK